MPLDIVILGPPGAGKGTQAEQIAAELGIPHVATGDMYPRGDRGRARSSATCVKSYMDAGELVPDEPDRSTSCASGSRARHQGRLRPRRLPAHAPAGRGARRRSSPTIDRDISRRPRLPAARGARGAAAARPRARVRAARTTRPR